MLLTVPELVTQVRNRVFVQNPDAGTVSEDYLVYSDGDLVQFLKMSASRIFPGVALENLPDGSEYPVVLLTAISLYNNLAVKYANKVDLGADNNNYLKLSQKFDHYKDLAEQAQEEYDNWLENEGAELLGIGVVNTYEVFRDREHLSMRTFQLQSAPTVTIHADSVTADTICIRWDVKNCAHFGRCKAYIGLVPVYDPYADGATYETHVTADARLVKSTNNQRDFVCRISDLEPETEYFIAVFAMERNQVYGVRQISVTTLAALPDEENFG